MRNRILTAGAFCMLLLVLAVSSGFMPTCSNSYTVTGGNTLNIAVNCQTTIPAPNSPGWIYTLSDGSSTTYTGSNGSWSPGSGSSVVISSGNWTLTATHNGQTASCSWNSPNSQVTFDHGSASITTDIQTSGG